MLAAGDLSDVQRIFHLPVLFLGVLHDQRDSVAPLPGIRMRNTWRATSPDRAVTKGPDIAHDAVVVAGTGGVEAALSLWTAGRKGGDRRLICGFRGRSRILRRRQRLRFRWRRGRARTGKQQPVRG